ncbi:chloramphenicol phosphotransferase CPT [Streptomyces sp. NPDC102381]|uniref:chloramphenicol phosphotransferase CPT n=1 Tax=Streptomyces sp. NPDC102381 TaxID=3366164 RepID=UPI00380BA3AB
MPQVIVLNGGSSSGKSSIARELQTLLLPEPWLSLSVDTLIQALPSSGAGIEFGADGSITVGPAFDRVEDAWMVGVAAMAAAGAPVIVDEVFLGGPHSQNRWRKALAGLDVLWVGVRCDAVVAAAREAARGDRIAGMAASQAALVHEGVTYDLVVDTTRTGAAECAREIVGWVSPR